MVFLLFFVINFENGERFRLGVFHNPAVIFLDVEEDVLFVIDNILDKESDIFTLGLIFKGDDIFIDKEVIGVDLFKVVSFAQASIDDASERFHDVACQGFSLVKEGVIYAAVDIESIDGEDGVDKVKEVRVSDIEEEVVDIAFAAGFAPSPIEVSEVCFEEQFGG